MDIKPNFRRTLDALEMRYIAYKRSNMLYDFTDYPQYLLDLLNTYNETIDGIDGLFVDEFQDVDAAQLAIFNKVTATKKVYIGDPWQSIYQFRNADGEVFNKLSNFELFKLKDNYRSHQEIIDYASTVYTATAPQINDSREIFITDTNYSESSGIKCHRGEGGVVGVIDSYSNVTGINIPFSSARELFG